MQPLSTPIVPEDYDINLTDEEINDAIRQLYPHVRENDHKNYLPRKWDRSQASSYLGLDSTGLTVSFKTNASIQGDKDPSGVVRADYSIPATVGTYYFEVHILEGHRGCMGVGLSKHGGELNRMPGWDPHCFGYHGDDGNFFSACGHGKPYGPKFETGDVIGCGIDTMLNIVFFTKNGEHLKVAHIAEPGQLVNLYPTVGLKVPGERLRVNFGQFKFMFDFLTYRDYLNDQKIHTLENVPMPADIGTYMDRVVTSFLGHSGALETLKAFEKVSKQSKPIDHEFLRKRKDIVDMVMNATYGSQIQQRIEEHFPGCLEGDYKVQLILMCLRYVDLANTMQKPPVSFCASISEPGRPSSPPTEVRSRPPKLLKGSHCKSTKRTREAHKKQGNQRSRTPPPVRRTNAKAAEDLCLKNSKIERFFTDADTGEEMISIGGLSITKKMYVELHTSDSDEFEKIAYMLKMGKEIRSLANKVRTELTTKDREIVERSVTMVLSPHNIDKHPLHAGYRRYISNVMVEMINNFAMPPVVVKEDVDESKPSGSADKTDSIKSAQPIPKENRIYSELRGMFLGWQALHRDACKADSASASIYFMRQMVLEDLKFEHRPVVYSNEPKEEAKGEDGAAVDNGDNGVVMEEGDNQGDSDVEEDV